MNLPLALKSRTIAGASSGPHLLITGGVHGDEFEPVAAVRRLMETLSPEALHGRVTLVPEVNEAACRRRSRTTEDGLDLARTCPGDRHGSVTERTAYALAELIRSVDYYVDLHTGGSAMRLMPMVGYMLHSDGAVLDSQRRMAHAFNLPVVWGTTSRLEGRSLSVARDAGVPAIYAEYGGGAECDSQGVQAYVEGCLNVAAALGMMNRPIVKSDVRYVVEDDRDQSGHLQTQHPAPCDGTFEPAVGLGDTLERGQPLGSIVRATDQTRATVHAAEPGMVLMLRCSRRVSAGGALAALLPICKPGEKRYGRDPEC